MPSYELFFYIQGDLRIYVGFMFGDVYFGTSNNKFNLLPRLHFSYTAKYANKMN